MKGTGTFATFALTTAVIGLIIGFALRSGYAQTDTFTVAPTSQAVLPTMGLSPGRTALVHVSNLTSDPASPAVAFNVLFVNSTGASMMPAFTCTLRPGETCTVPLTADQCGITSLGSDNAGVPIRCEFRALVLTDGISAPPPGSTDAGEPSGGSWSTNMEMIDASGRSVSTSSAIAPMAIPIQSGSVGTDGGITSGGTDGPTAGGGL